MSASTFPDRLAAACARHGRLCVGIDPHGASLAGWGLDDDLAGLERFSRGLVAVLAGHVGVFKPQSAFFEAHGPDGLRVLQDTLADIADAGATSILDVKRGDIGSTMQAYARAYLAPGAPLAADAITASPYLGFASLAPAVEAAAEAGRGVFVLARTSNPEGAAVQLAIAPDRSGDAVAQQVVAAAAAANRDAGTPLVGLVVGATLPVLDIDLTGFDGWILAPGIGAQGGRPDALSRLFGEAAPRVLPSASREVTAAGPDPARLRERVARLSDACAQVAVSS
ncbi:MAG: orotidine-5'-phosphate decarboxylase [Actinomycetia bacterium]|nr:orotidine-5'-phosphate decarboxylase [Actinomycetes bacterium]